MQERICVPGALSLVVGGFFFQAEDGIRDGHVTGVQTCALPISPDSYCASPHPAAHGRWTALPPSKKRLMNPDANIATPLPAQEKSTGTIPQPPAARREPVEHILHGDRRVDHYAWLRHKENPEVIDYLKAENAYTDAVLKPTEPLQEKLYQEMLMRIQQTDLSVPYRLRGYLYFTRTEEGKQYA